MASDRLMVLLNAELINDIIRHMHVEGVKRRPMEQLTHGALAAFLDAAGDMGPAALERVSGELDCFCKHFSIA
jgi:hypothetical protein